MGKGGGGGFFSMLGGNKNKKDKPDDKKKKDDEGFFSKVPNNDESGGKGGRKSGPDGIFGRGDFAGGNTGSDQTAGPEGQSAAASDRDLFDDLLNVAQEMSEGK